jgi:flavin-dependent dehydrogenase
MGAVRSRLPAQLGVERTFDPRDLSLCFREVVKLAEPYPWDDSADIYLDEEAAPGGYWWAFPKGSGLLLNVGLGVQMSRGVNPKRKYEEHVLREPYMKGREVLDARAGVVPTRRPISRMVLDGCVIVGDAASTANPLHGGGIGPSMYSAKLAAEAAVAAVEAGDYSASALWPAARKYMTTYGARAAALDVFRIFLQRLTNADLNFGMSRKLIADEDLQALSDGRKVEVPLTEKAKRIVKGLARPSLLKKLVWVSQVMSEAYTLYLEYPESPAGLEAWTRRVDELFAKVWGEVA